MAKVKSLTGEQGAQVTKSEVFNTVKGNIADKMLIDTRDKKQEESKEKPDLNMNRYPKISKG